MCEKNNKQLYLIRWLSDGAFEVTSGAQIEAIRHSEKKWYKGKLQMEIVRKATGDDKKNYPIVL